MENNPLKNWMNKVRNAVDDHDAKLEEEGQAPGEENQIPPEERVIGGRTGLRANRKRYKKTFLQRTAAYLERYHGKYGVLGIIAAVAVVIKIFMFYGLIGVSSNLIVIGLITCFFTYLLFSAFTNKWIPAIVFALLSILMFADVTYCSFFNRYLSVNMLGAAEFVGDITASIKEVLRPSFFLLLLDAVLVIAALIAAKVSIKKKLRIKPLRRLIPILLIVALLILNVTGSGFAQSISNQEIITYHIKDILSGGSGDSSGSLDAFTDDYEAEKDGPLFGVAKDRNLIVLQVESLQNFVVGLEYNGQEITPNLNALMKDNTVYFDNYYQQVGSGNTSDAEFATNNSIYGSLASYTYKLYADNYYRGLPVLLSEQGYDTAVFHAHEDRSFWNRENAYPAMGFNRYYGGLTGRGGDYDMTEWMGWGLTDSEFFEQTVEYMKELQEPFYSFVITISNHHPYQMLEHYDFVDLLPEDEGTIVGNYLNSAAYTDYALGLFFQMLKDNGMYDNAVFALYGDHVGLTHTEEIDASMERMLDKPYDFEDLMNVPFLLHVPNADREVTQTISAAGGQLDFLPTIASLMGFETLDTIYLGHNMLTVKEGFAAEQTYMTKGSFFENEIAYEMSRDGVFQNGRAWNIYTGEEVSLDDCYDGYIRSTDIVNTSEYILKSDAIRKVFLEGQSAEEAGSMAVGRTHPAEIVNAGVPNGDLIGTNSIEALDYSYEQGYRTIRLDTGWNQDSEPVTINQKTGQEEMNYEEIIDWLERHGSANVVMNVPKSGDYLITFIKERSPAAIERVILEVPTTEEYTGRYEGILDARSSGLDGTSMAEFVDRYKVWAVKLTAEEAVGDLLAALEGKTEIYIEGENGTIAKRD